MALSFPFRADDLPASVRISAGDHRGGTQAEGKDFGAQRHLGGNQQNQWAALTPDDPGPASRTNEHFVVNGLPFYAMADGEVIGAWRNAPDNPEPPAVHSANDDTGPKYMAGGGNHLWIRHTDGTVALYAHAQKGSIPPELCPYEAALFAEPKDAHPPQPGVDSHVYVPPGVPPSVPTGSTILVDGSFVVVQRPQVREGQLLGSVGNSGDSSGPHLHCHVQTETGTPVPMRFDRGLFTPMTGDTADIDAWTPLEGDALPDQNVLIWPPRKLHAEYARAAFAPAGFRRLYQHLRDSGYMPVWFDGYHVADESFYNHIWRPATIGWRLFRGRTAAEHVADWNAALDDGYSPVHVDSYLRPDGQVRYAGIYVQDGTTAVRGAPGLSRAAHRAMLQQARETGLSPVAVSVVSAGGQRSYTTLYRPEPIGRWEVDTDIPVSQFQQEFDLHESEGRLPHYVSSYRHNGQFFIAAVFAEADTATRVTHHGLDRTTLQQLWSQHVREEGLLTRVLSGYDGAQGGHSFVGVWS